MALYKILINPLVESSGFCVPPGCTDVDNDTPFGDLFATNLIVPSNIHELFLRTHLLFKSFHPERLLAAESQKRITAGIYNGVGIIPKTEPITSLFDLEQGRLLSGLASETVPGGEKTFKYFDGVFSKDMFHRVTLSTTASFNIFKAEKEYAFTKARVADIYTFSESMVSSNEGSERKAPNQVICNILDHLLDHHSGIYSSLCCHQHNESLEWREKEFSTFVAKYRWTIYDLLVQQHKFECTRHLFLSIQETLITPFPRQFMLDQLPDDKQTIPPASSEQVAFNNKFPGVLSHFYPPIYTRKEWYFTKEEVVPSSLDGSEYTSWNLFHPHRKYVSHPNKHQQMTPQVLSFFVNLITCFGCHKRGLILLKNVFKNNGDRVEKGFPTKGFIFDFVEEGSDGSKYKSCVSLSCLLNCRPWLEFF